MRPLNAATPAQIAAFRALVGRKASPAQRAALTAGRKKGHEMNRARRYAKLVQRNTTPFVTSHCLEHSDGYTLQLPLKTEASNANGNRHLAHKKRSQQFDMVLAACQSQLRNMDRERVCAIELTRIGPKPLDAHDNLPQSFKHVVDAVCSYIARGDDFDDKDRRRIGSFDDKLIGQGKVSCRYDQTVHELDRRLYGIRIRFRLRPKSETCTTT